MKYVVLVLLSLTIQTVTKSASAQDRLFGPVPNRESGIRVNSVQNMSANGDTLWIGPIMNSNIANRPDWRIPLNADSVINGRGRMFSVKASGLRVFAGIATNVERDGESIPTAMGFYLSMDGGEQWSWIPQPLQAEDDTLFIYGGETYTMLPVIVPEQSPSYEVEFIGDVFFSANWATGLLRSMDGGQNWERLILPPVNVDVMEPGERYQFYNATGANQPENARDYDPRPNNSLSNNYLGYSVLVDQFNRLWVGTAGGFNISDNALSASRDQIVWRHFATALNPGRMLGNWVITLREDIPNQKMWMTNWATSQNEQEGILEVDLDLSNFRKHLVGERIFDISIKGDTILAVGERGLFISPDYGNSWINRKQISSPNAFIRSDARFQSTSVTSDGRMWVGTSDGIASTLDLVNWEITRVDIPLDGNTVYAEQPSVRSYPYPNPFSPSVHQLMRIKFDLQGSGGVQLRIFDAAMRLVEEQNLGNYTAGTYEAVWDGQDQYGYTVPNGIYLYQIEQDGNRIQGKIVVAQ